MQMSAKIIRMRPAKRSKQSAQQAALQHLGNLPDIDADFTTAVRAFINHIVREYVMDGGRMNSLALKANLAFATISRLAYYETARPQWHTIMAVIMALDKFDEFVALANRYVEAHGK